MKYVVIKTDVTTTTEVYEVDIDTRNYSYPTAEDRAISATAHAQPIAKQEQRDFKYRVMPKEEEHGKG